MLVNNGIPLKEIQTVLGTSPNQTKTFLKSCGLEHDGSSEMLYPRKEAKVAIDKFVSQKRQQQMRRKKVSEQRRSKNHKFDETSVQKVAVSATMVSRQEASKLLGLEVHQIKSAIRHGLLVEDENRMIDRTYLEQTNAENLTEKLEELKSYSTESVSEHFGMAKGNFLAMMESVFFDMTSARYDNTLPISNDSKIIDFRDFPKGSLDPFTIFETEKVNVMWDVKAIEDAMTSEEIDDWRIKDFSGVHDLHENIVIKSDQVKRNVVVTLPVRKNPLKYVGFHLGPTNSGKTYKALENLCEEFINNPQGKYVYSAPLRMLAYEVYVKMVDRFGVNNVGFLTGEEQINPDAPIIAATVEMTPMQGDVVIIDEAHWILEDERGHYWTRLITSGDFARMHIIAAQEALDGLHTLVSDAQKVEVEVFKRRTGIVFDGVQHISNIKEKTAVVAFTRKDVYSIYDKLLLEGKKACVLYGALPVTVRKKQIHDYENGVYDIVVTTNVIGHGINLPIDNIVFAGDERFDGEKMIEIPLWEAGQISGRAGRYGLSDRGTVSSLEGLPWIEVDSEMVKDGVNVAAGRLESGLDVDKVYIAPSFKDFNLGENDNMYLLEALDAWSAKVLEESNFIPAPMRIARLNLKAISEHLNLPLLGVTALSQSRGNWRMTAETLWQLASGPFDSRHNILTSAAEWLNEKSKDTSNIMSHAFLTYTVGNESMDLETLESSFKSVSELKMLLVMNGVENNLGTLPPKAIFEKETALVGFIQAALDNYQPRKRKN